MTEYEIDHIVPPRDEVDRIVLRRGEVSPLMTPILKGDFSSLKDGDRPAIIPAGWKVYWRKVEGEK